MEKEAKYQRPSRGAHVLALTNPTQGHINPVLQFSKLLASKGLKVTLITTTSVSFQLSPETTKIPNFDFLTIYDGFREGDKAADLDAYLERMRTSICQSLLELLNHYRENKRDLQPTPKMVIYDSFMPWVLDVVRKCGLKGAPFFTQSCVVSSLYYYVYKGGLKTPMNGSLVSMPSLKGMLRVDDLPSFVSFPCIIYQAIRRLVLEQFSNVEEVDCLFVNTVDKLEPEVCH